MLNLKVVAGVIVCGLMTGCGGFATSEDISEVRSILEELEVVEKKPVKTDDVAQNDSTQDNTNDNNDNDTVDAGDQNPAPTPTEPEVVEQTPPLSSGIATLEFSLFPVGIVFEKGTRIRIAITGADADNYIQTPVNPAPEITVFSGGNHKTKITLPMIKDISGLDFKDWVDPRS